MARKYNIPAHEHTCTTIAIPAKMNLHTVDILTNVSGQLNAIHRGIAAVKVQDTQRIKQLAEAHDALVEIVDNLFSSLEEPLKTRRRGLKLLDRTVNVAQLNISMVIDDLSGNSKTIQKPLVQKLDELPSTSVASNLAAIWGSHPTPGPETGAIPKAGPSRLNADAAPFHMTTKPDPQQEQKLNHFVNGLGLSLDEVNRDPQLRRDLDYSMRTCEATAPAPQTTEATEAVEAAATVSQ